MTNARKMKNYFYHFFKLFSEYSKWFCVRLAVWRKKNKQAFFSPLFQAISSGSQSGHSTAFEKRPQTCKKQYFQSKI